MEEQTTKAPLPPYLSWRTLAGYLESLRQTIPPRIDTSGMILLSGTNRNLVMNALKFLKLVNEDKSPHPDLRQLVEYAKQGNKVEYQSLLRAILQRAYPVLFDTQTFDLANATPAHFAEQFKAMGVSGETIRKSQTFFIEAAKEAGITVSSLILASRKKGRKAGSPAIQRRTGGTGSMTGQLILPAGETQLDQPTDYWYGKLKVFIEELPPSDARSWKKSERDAWIQGITAFFDMLIKVREEDE